MPIVIQGHSAHWCIGWGSHVLENNRSVCGRSCTDTIYQVVSLFPPVPLWELHLWFQWEPAYANTCSFWSAHPTDTNIQDQALPASENKNQQRNRRWKGQQQLSHPAGSNNQARHLFERTSVVTWKMRFHTGCQEGRSPLYSRHWEYPPNFLLTIKKRKFTACFWAGCHVKDAGRDDQKLEVKIHRWIRKQSKRESQLRNPEKTESTKLSLFFDTTKTHNLSGNIFLNTTLWRRQSDLLNDTAEMENLRSSTFTNPKQSSYFIAQREYKQTVSLQ